MKKMEYRPNGVNVLSLFDGISCGQLALERANIKVNTYIASEIKKFAINHTMEKYPSTLSAGDVTKLHYVRRTKTLYANCKRRVIDSLANHSGKMEWTKDEVAKFKKKGYKLSPNGEVVKWTYDKSNIVFEGEIDLLIGGSPCQGFSSAFNYCKNPNKGLKHIQSKLFFEYLRLLEEVKPTYFLLENVVMKKKDQIALNKYLGVEGIAINSKLLSYQNRPRMYWTNIKGVTAPKDANIDFQNYMLKTLPKVERWIRASKFEGNTKPLELTKSEIEHIYSTNLWAYKELKAINPFLTKEGFVNELHNKILWEACVKKAPFRDKMWNNGTSQGEYVSKNITNESKIGCLCRKQDRSPNSGCISFDSYFRLLSRLEICRAQNIPYKFMDAMSYTQIQDGCGDGWTIDVIAHIFGALDKVYDFGVVAKENVESVSSLVSLPMAA